MINKRFLHYFAITILLSCSSITMHSMENFKRGLGEGMGKRIGKNITKKKDKGFFDYLIDILWINYLLAPSSNSRENEEENSHEKLVDYKPRARFLTKLVKSNDQYNFKRQKKQIQDNSEIELEGLNQYEIYLQQQAASPLSKAVKKMITNGLFYGGITTALGASCYYFLNLGFAGYRPDGQMVGIGSILGIGAILSTWYTKLRIEKHLPSTLSNRKKDKIPYVIKANNWAVEIRDHIENTPLILKDSYEKKLL